MDLIKQPCSRTFPTVGKPNLQRRKIFSWTSEEKSCLRRPPRHWVQSVIFYVCLYLVIAAIWGTAFYLVHKYYIPDPEEDGKPIFGYGRGGLFSGYFQIHGSEPGISIRPKIQIKKITANAIYDISDPESQRQYEQDMNEFVQNEAPPGFESGMGVAATVNVDQVRERRIRRHRRSLQERHLEGDLVAAAEDLGEDFSRSLIIPGEDTNEVRQGVSTPPRTPRTNPLLEPQDRSEGFTSVVEGDILTHNKGKYGQPGQGVHGSSYHGHDSPIVHGSDGMKVLQMTESAGASTCGGQGLGYDNRQPCFLIRPGRIFGWKPDPHTDFDEMEKTMPKRIPMEYFGVAKNSMSPGEVWVACYPFQGALRLEKLTYIGAKVGGSPVNGFPIEGYFPAEARSGAQKRAALRNGEPKHSPMPYMYVKFHLRDNEELKKMSNGTSPPRLEVQCFQLAKNIPLNLITRAGMSSFSIEAGGAAALHQDGKRVAKFVLLVLFFWFWTKA